ncbi:unnamed protein product [Rotaria sp. Silwood1]|nr:unnamed protein product [Rotaria sp. Silwood1]CAF3619705.1 unnamed protein product [Rotaria sp. Silwood1]CAF4615600.1 unnamed protein product [Rotaria sp. Silwood1]
MAMHNSSATDNEHDSDITIINSLLSTNLDDASTNVYIPVLKNSQQTNESSNTTQPITSNVVYDQNNQTNSDSSHDYIFIQHDLQETTKQLEQILYYYQQDLTQESNTSFDCNRNLITRLVDLIRPVYSLNQEKMKNLNTLVDDISDLHDKRIVEQKEKNEQFHLEISHLKKLIVTSENEDNTSRKIYRINSLVDYEEWMELEEETKKLHKLVEHQQNQINELNKLISQEGEYEKTVKNEKHHTTTYSIRPLTRELQNNIKTKCCVCDYEYSNTCNETEIQNHVKNCLSTISLDNLNVSIERIQLECPFCDKKLLNNGDIADLEHLTICCSQLHV